MVSILFHDVRRQEDHAADLSMDFAYFSLTRILNPQKRPGNEKIFTFYEIFYHITENFM